MDNSPPEQDISNLACPNCHGALGRNGKGLPCQSCSSSFLDRGPYLDLMHKDVEAPKGMGPRLMRVRVFARIYEKYWRPTFVSIAMAGRADMKWEQNRVKDLFSTVAGGEVLDLCCGPGFMARYLASAGVASRVYGLDASRAMLEQAEQLVEDEDAAPIVWVRADVDKLPFQSGSLSAIHAGASLHLWSSPDLALKEIARVLKPGGVFFASTFMRSGDGVAARSLQYAFDRFASTHIFSDKELRGLVENAGMEGYSTSVRGGFVYLNANAPNAQEKAESPEV